MKKILIITVILSFVLSCNFEKNSNTSKTITNEIITVDKKEITIENERIKIGDKIADAKLITPVNEFNKMEEVKLLDDKKIKVIYTAPSLDTPVCSLQTKFLNEKAKENQNISFYSITNDLPFAMMRYTTANDITNLKLLSDFKKNEFAIKNGFLMKEYQLLTRALIIVDENDIVQYVDYGSEVTEKLDVNKAMEFLEKNIIKK